MSEVAQIVEQAIIDGRVPGRWSVDTTAEQSRAVVAALRAAGWGDLREAAEKWRKFIPCPTCEDPMSRETEGLVCQTCGHDYGTEETTA